MPSTVGGLVIVVVAVLPGLLYTLAFERYAGAFGATLADRTMRFVAGSVIFHLVAGWPEYYLYRVALAGGGPNSAREFGLLWLAGLLAVTASIIAGSFIGYMYKTRRNRSRWQKVLLKVILGADVAPRAWDDYFSERPTAYLRVRMTDGLVLAGLFAKGSYAAGFPHDPDLLLERAYKVDQETGVLGDPLDYSLYIPAGRIAWLEIIDPGHGEGGG